MENRFMNRALELAREAAECGEIPVGAVIVRNGEIIACGRNRREEARDALGHAEIEAIHNACSAIGSWRLAGCDLYVTLEPCPMCAGAVINARIENVYYGASDPRAGAADSVLRMFCYPFDHRPQFFGGIMEKESEELLADFFGKIRQRRGE